MTIAGRCSSRSETVAAGNPSKAPWAATRRSTASQPAAAGQDLQQRISNVEIVLYEQDRTVSLEHGTASSTAFAGSQARHRLKYLAAFDSIVRRGEMHARASRGPRWG